MKEKLLFTSESVTEGHPDKVADQISDAILDAILTQDPQARVACETAVNTGLVLVMGEVTTTAYVDIQKVVRQTLVKIGYTNPDFGFNAEDVAVIVSLDEQSADIAQGVDQALEVRVLSGLEQEMGAAVQAGSTDAVQSGEGERSSVAQVELGANVRRSQGAPSQGGTQPELGAGDQGLMFGYACRESANYMPLAIDLSHRLAKQLAKVRKTGLLPYLGPDGKTQVTVEYDETGQVKRLDALVVSSQHQAGVSQAQIRQDLIEHVIHPIVPQAYLDADTKIYVNPTGSFVIGGPKGDSGLTGRKIIVDTYGGRARHGGGAFSGKDATKVDRSAAYAARHVAKNFVAAGIANELEVQLAYAIGVAQPVSIAVESFGTSDYSNQELAQAVRHLFDLRPQAIIDRLDLRRPIYQQTAAYGHFGQEDADFSWEALDQVQAIRDYFN